MTSRTRFLAARAGYVAIILIATLSDLEFSPDLAAAAERLAHAFALEHGWRDAIDGIRNVVLFAGFGGVWVITSMTGRGRAEILRATLAGVAISVGVEGAQCFSPVRFASIIDVTTNGIGALGGAFAMGLLIDAVRAHKGARSYLGIPAFLLAGSYGIAALCEALTPLFHSAVRTYLPGGPVARLRFELGLAFPFSFNEIPFSNIALMATAGFLAVMWLGERGWVTTGRSLMFAFMASALIVAAHVVHGAFGLPVRWEAAATDVLATGMGVWAGQRWIPVISQQLRGAARARAAAFAYVGLLVLWGWRPFFPETNGQAIALQFEVIRWIPLASLASREDVFSAAHVAQQFFLYAPLGALLAVWPLRLGGHWSHLRPALWLAAGIEAGHILIAERTFDATNALIAIAGLGIGWIVVRRAGFAPYGPSLPQPGGGAHSQPAMR
jgi:glycopeptide antibiotics resistance protein